MKKRLKKIWKQYSILIPIILYPYVYIPCLLLMGVFDMTMKSASPSLFSQMDPTKISTSVYFYGCAIYTIFLLCFCIFLSVSAIAKKLPAHQMAWRNLVVKLFYLPSYIFHFVMGFLGIAMGLWGIAFVLIALIINIVSIVANGIIAVGCSMRMKQEGLLSTWKAIFLSICSFIFFIDIAVAIAFVVTTTKKLVKDIS